LEFGINMEERRSVSCVPGKRKPDSPKVEESDLGKIKEFKEEMVECWVVGENGDLVNGEHISSEKKPSVSCSLEGKNEDDLNKDLDSVDRMEKIIEKNQKSDSSEINKIQGVELKKDQNENCDEDKNKEKKNDCDGSLNEKEGNKDKTEGDGKIDENS
jgi:hypothetical protein